MIDTLVNVINGLTWLYRLVNGVTWFEIVIYIWEYFTKTKSQNQKKKRKKEKPCIPHPFLKFCRALRENLFFKI